MNPSRRNQKQTVLDIFNRKADDRIERKQTQKELLTAIQQKNSQISVLDHVNTRLGAQLVILQKKLGIDHGIVLKQLQQINQISAAFHFQTQQLLYLDALLTAYDENNLKQKKLIAHLYNSLEDAQKRCQNLVKDNQFLLNQMQEKTQQILNIYTKGFIDDNLTSSYSKLQRQTQLQMMQNLRTQNQYLLQNYRSLETKFQKQEQQSKQLKKKSDYYFQLYKKQSQDVKLSLIKIDDLLKIKQVLQKKFDEVTQQNIQLQTVRGQLQNKISRIDGDNKQLRNQLHLQRTLKHQQVQRVGQQFQSLKFQHQASEKRQRQLFNKNMILEKDFQNQKDDLRMLRKQLEKTKSQFEQTLKMCQAYETKINTYNKKQKIMIQGFQDSKQRLENALLQRDKAIMKQKQLQKIIDNIKQRNRDEIQVLKTTFEKVIFQQNEKIKILQEDKDESNSIFYQNQVSLKHQIQKLRKQNQMLKQQNFRHADSIKNNTGVQIINKLKQLEQKNQNYSRQINQKQRIYREDIQHKEQIIRNLQSENRELVRQVDRQRTSARQAINQRTQLKSKISMIQKQKQCHEQQITRLKRAIDNRTNSAVEEKQAKIRQLQQSLAEAIKRQKTLKQNTIKLLQKQTQIQQQMRLQYQNKIHAEQTQNKKLKRKIQKLQKEKR